MGHASSPRASLSSNRQGPALLALFVAGLVTVVLGACGSKSSSPPPPDPSVLWIDTTPAEQAAICDWANGLAGGYGGSIPCNSLGEQLNAAASQQVCVQAMENSIAAVPNCPATVSQWESCWEAITSNLCAALEASPAACAEIDSAACSAPSDAGPAIVPPPQHSSIRAQVVAAAISRTKS